MMFVIKILQLLLLLRLLLLAPDRVRNRNRKLERGTGIKREEGEKREGKSARPAHPVLTRYQFNVVGRVEPHAAVFSALAPALFVFVLELLKNVTCEWR